MAGGPKRETSKKIFVCKRSLRPPSPFFFLSGDLERMSSQGGLHYRRKKQKRGGEAEEIEAREEKKAKKGGGGEFTIDEQ